jgi:hypothetical protein
MVEGTELETIICECEEWEQDPYIRECLISKIDPFCPEHGDYCGFCGGCHSEYLICQVEHPTRRYGCQT